jgi:hypothetical protein
MEATVTASCKSTTEAFLSGATLAYGKDPHAGIQNGALVLHSKQQTIRNGQGKSLRVGGRPFVGKANLSKDDLLRTAVAAYNSGLWAYYNLTKYGDPDRRTTGRDYSKDTLRRAQTFRKLLRSA